MLTPNDLGSPVPGKYRRWTTKEVARLQWDWAAVSIDELAKALNRTPGSVERKARSLGLAVVRATMSLNQLMKHSGFADKYIWEAVSALSLKIRTAPRCDSKRSGRSNIWAFSEEQQEAIVEYLLRTHPGGYPVYKITANSKKTPRHLWGVGLKPPNCLGCGRTDRPHRAKGYCKACYGSRTRPDESNRPAPNDSGCDRDSRGLQETGVPV